MASTTSSNRLPSKHTSSNGVHSSPHTRVPNRLYSLAHPPSLSTFKQLCSQTTDPETYQLPSIIVSNIPVYNLPDQDTVDHEYLGRLQDEWHHILLSGPGVFVLRGFMPDPNLINHVNTIFNEIITNESSGSNAKGDHFASAGTNARIWNSFRK